MKNAFNLQLIDCMSEMLRKKDPEMNNFQVSCHSFNLSISVFAKIRMGFRPPAARWMPVPRFTHTASTASTTTCWKWPEDWEGPHRRRARVVSTEMKKPMTSRRPKRKLKFVPQFPRTCSFDDKIFFFMFRRRTRKRLKPTWNRWNYPNSTWNTTSIPCSKRTLPCWTKVAMEGSISWPLWPWRSVPQLTIIQWINYENNYHDFRTMAVNWYWTRTRCPIPAILRKNPSTLIRRVSYHPSSVIYNHFHYI